MAWARYLGSPTDLHSTRTRRIVFPERNVTVRSHVAFGLDGPSVTWKSGRAPWRVWRTPAESPLSFFTLSAIFTVRVNHRPCACLLTTRHRERLVERLATSPSRRLRAVESQGPVLRGECPARHCGKACHLSWASLAGQKRYLKRFGKRRPDVIVSIEERARVEEDKKALRRGMKRRRAGDDAQG